MVFFTCNCCGESLKKKAVEKHNYRCRTSQGLTCVDCHKVFGDDYAAHLSCISEQEKYGGSNYDPKIMKGQKKQEGWMGTLQKLSQKSGIDPQVKKALDDILMNQNIPRNVKKFKNYAINSVRLRPAIVEKLADFIFKNVANLEEKENKEQKEKEKEIEENNKRKHDGEEDSTVQKKKSKKERKNDGSPEVEMSQECTQDGDMSTADQTSEKSKKKKKSKGKETEEIVEAVNGEGEIDTCTTVKKSKKNKISLEVDNEQLEVLSTEDVRPNKEKKRKSKTNETSESVQEESNINDTSKEKTSKKRKSSHEKDNNKENNQNSVKSTEEKLGRITGETEDLNIVEDNETTMSDASEFKWKTAIKKTLKANDSKMKLKKLEKIIVEEYLQTLQKDQSTQNDAKELFKKKINNDKFIIEDKYVKLI